MLTIVMFVIAIAVLVAIHELGHYAMARACGVKVLRFSVGFGPKLWGWTSRKSGTEFLIAVLPIGGYVKMLDEGEDYVAPQERPLAFNLQPLRSKAAIVIAGPMANLALAVVLYCAVNWTGIEQPQAILAKPQQGTILERAGFAGGERVRRAGFEGEALDDVVSFEGFRWWLARGAIEHRNIQVEFSPADHRGPQSTLLMLGAIDVSSADAKLFEKIGLLAPFSQARVGALMPEGAAAKAKLQVNDLVLRVDETDIVDAAQLRELIRLSGRRGTPHPQNWSVQRGDARLTITVSPKPEQEGERTVGRVGAFIGGPPAVAMVKYGLIDGAVQALQHTWETSALTLRVMGQIVIGEASLNNLSGPITIADYAGKSAAMGLTPFLLFLALMSVSLGVLNLLPLPVLDGGHLMYYLWQALSGRPVSQPWTERLQKVGLVILLLMMSVAVYNDVTRLLR